MSRNQEVLMGPGQKKKKNHKISRQPYRDTCDKRNDWFFSHSLQGLKSKE